jgi:hypothetical protein
MVRVMAIFFFLAALVLNFHRMTWWKFYSHQLRQDDPSDKLHTFCVAITSLSRLVDSNKSICIPLHFPFLLNITCNKRDVPQKLVLHYSQLHDVDVVEEQ